MSSTRIFLFFKLLIGLLQPSASRLNSPPNILLESAASCIICSDIGSPTMTKNCSTSKDIINKNCIDNATWLESKHCRFSCFQAGRGYEGDVCCDDDSSDESFMEYYEETRFEEDTPIEQFKKPLKVFLMVGQSNVQGHGYVDARDLETNEYRKGTLEWLTQHHPKEFGKLKNQSTGEWIKRDDVWVAYNKQRYSEIEPEIHQYGHLQAGNDYGGDPREHNHMGPELGFGWTVGDALNSKEDEEQQQILLIKIAWGGKTLAVDYRPPSSGGITGPYYQSMVANTLRTLSRISELFPEYDAIGHYELVGFIWHQGWTDAGNDTMTEEYEYNLANLIRDVRADLGIHDLPVSIGVSGQLGYHDDMNSTDMPHDWVRRDLLINAQLAVAENPEFAGTVKSVETRSFFRPESESPGDQNYHWNNNCEAYWLIGKAMGQAMLELLNDKEEESA